MKSLYLIGPWRSFQSGRMQTAEDTAYGVVYFLSDESSQVTGSELALSGGLGL